MQFTDAKVEEVAKELEQTEEAQERNSASEND
jgi:hypothetical protein